VSVAPEVFELDETAGLAVVRLAEPPLELHARVEQAVALCPTRAITTALEE
jgi:ferredoxin